MNQTYDLYAIGHREVSGVSAAIPAEYSVEFFSPTLYRLRLAKQGSLLVNVYWYFMCQQGYKILYVRHESTIIHWSHVVSRTFRFNFMKKGDWGIGPSWTAPEYRGKNIFPAAIQYIVAKRPISGCWYVFAKSDNFASKRAIEKAGCRFVAIARRTGLFKIYSTDS